MAENFTGVPGKYVPVKETVRGFKAIIDGEMDEYPEAAFFNVGTIDEVVEKAKAMQEGAPVTMYFIMETASPWWFRLMMGK